MSSRLWSGVVLTPILRNNNSRVSHQGKENARKLLNVIRPFSFQSHLVVTGIVLSEAKVIRRARAF